MKRGQTLNHSYKSLWGQLRYVVMICQQFGNFVIIYFSFTVKAFTKPNKKISNQKSHPGNGKNISLGIQFMNSNYSFQMLLKKKIQFVKWQQVKMF